ncbi:MAG TPA: flippase-like domain-containing protein [Anaerolineae bacterium]|nr:flippase-like domain-containing protein [Anaerolineae bacterium]
MASKASSKGEILRLISGLIISLGAIGLIFLVVDVHEVGIALKDANLLLLLFAVPIYVISFGARAMGWRSLLKKEVPFRRVFLVMNVGYLLNNILPFRMGEIGRTILLGRTHGYLRVLATIIMERSFDLIFAASLLLGTLPFALTGNQMQARMTGFIVGGFVVIAFLLLYLVVRFPLSVKRIIERIFVRRADIVKILHEKLESVLQGLSVLSNLKRFMIVLSWMGLGWALAILVQYIVLKSVVPQAEIAWAAFVLASSSLGVAIPSSPAYVGVFEGVVIGALAFFKVETSQALAFALIYHMMYIAVTGLFGVIGLAKEGQNLGLLYRQIRERRFGKGA